MAGSDTSNARKGGGKKSIQEKLQALQEIGRDFDSLVGVAGGGRTGGDLFGEALSDQSKDKEGGGEKQAEGPGALRGLDQMTRNLQFAEALAGERRDLDAGTRARMEGMLGKKLDGVQVYVGKQAEAAAKVLGAEAFAVGKHIFVQESKFSTTSAEGVGLLAHEFTHAFQDAGSREKKEEEAHAVESRVMQGVRQGADRELAMDQAPMAGLLKELGGSEGAGPQSAGGKPPDQDFDPAATHDSPDEKEVERQILERTLELWRNESDLDFERHGFGS